MMFDGTSMTNRSCTVDESSRTIMEESKLLDWKATLPTTRKKLDLLCYCSGYNVFLQYNNQQRFPPAPIQDRSRITPERELYHCIKHLTERRTYRKSAVVTLMPSWIQAGFHYQAGEVDVKWSTVSLLLNPPRTEKHSSSAGVPPSDTETRSKPSATPDKRMERFILV